MIVCAAKRLKVSLAFDLESASNKQLVLTI